jgi:hypothetical protein
MNDLVDSIRSQIEEQHAKALEALKVLAGYLGNANLLNGYAVSPRQASVPSEKRHRGSSTESFRTQVLNAIVRDWATIAIIAEQTGLAIRQVRGAINATGFSAKIEKRNGPNGTEYRALPKVES